MNYIRLIASMYVGFLTGWGCFAQTARPSSADYFNQFQRFVDERNSDSAFYCAQQLAVDDKSGILNFLMHDSVAQRFTSSDSSRADSLFSRQLLQTLFTGGVPLQRSVYPLYMWVDAKHSVGDSAKIRQIVAGFMVAQSRSQEEQGNRIDRYALLICQLLKPKPEYAALADTLLNHTRQRLEHAVNGLYYQSVDDRVRRNPRAYFRYLMAYSSFSKANECIRQQDLATAETYFKEASQFSPDENDRQAKSAYFYESVMLLNGGFADGFQRRYADFLLEKGDTVAAIQAVTELTIADPGSIDLLKTYYRKAPVDQLAFADYWTKSLNAKLKPAEAFSLTSIDNRVLDYRQYKGKWVLIDFWGTWCKPCVEELPRFQAFYDELSRSKRENLVVLTVACSDTEVRVKEFMKQHNYTFPVAMGDKNKTIEKSFRVGEYPTKVLITPQGNRMKIPSGASWDERVKIYTDN